MPIIPVRSRQRAMVSHVVRDRSRGDRPRAGPPRRRAAETPKAPPPHHRKMSSAIQHKMMPSEEVMENWRQMQSRSRSRLGTFFRPLTDAADRHRVAIVRFLAFVQVSTSGLVLVQGLGMLSEYMGACAPTMEALWTVGSGAVGVVGSFLAFGPALRPQPQWSAGPALAGYTVAILLSFLGAARTIVYSAAVEASCLASLDALPPCQFFHGPKRRERVCGVLCLVPQGPQPDAPTRSYYLRDPVAYLRLLARHSNASLPALLAAAGNGTVLEPAPSSFVPAEHAGELCQVPLYRAHIMLLLMASVVFMAAVLLLCRQWNPGKAGGEWRRQGTSSSFASSYHRPSTQIRMNRFNPSVHSNSTR